ncbi:MAG: tRNA (guanosine(37)-N1)-methyltransferase TrmD, partial [Nitrospirota bacterium]
AMRLIPGVLGDPHSAQKESFVESLLDFPHFTKPVEIRGMSVPDILMSGNHEAVRRWRRKESLRQTLLKRPDLLDHHIWSSEDRQLLEEIEHNYTSTSSRTTRP